MNSVRNMVIGAAALAASGVSAMPRPDAGPPARLIVGVYNPATPVGPTKAEWPFGCWFANGWHGPGYYWCGYRPAGYYAYHPAYYRYGYYHRRHRVRHAWRREHRRWRA